MKISIRNTTTQLALAILNVGVSCHRVAKKPSSVPKIMFAWTDPLEQQAEIWYFSRSEKKKENNRETGQWGTILEERNVCASSLSNQRPRLVS